MNRIPVRYALAPDYPEKVPKPSYAHEGDSGLDVFAISSHHLPPGVRALVRTGLILELSPGYEAQVRPRSGLALNHGLTVLNSPGTIDSGYRGEVCAIVINHGTKPIEIAVGTKIAQLVFAPVVRADLMPVDLDAITETKRGAGGFGSTE